MDSNNETRRIYDVDDDLEDRDLLSEELSKSPARWEIFYFNNVDELLEYHFNQTNNLEGSQAIALALILLNGFPKLRSIRDEVRLLSKSEALGPVSRVITVCSQSEADYLKDFNLAVRCCLVKPIRLADLNDYINE